MLQEVTGVTYNTHLCFVCLYLQIMLPSFPQLEVYVACNHVETGQKFIFMPLLYYQAGSIIIQYKRK